MTRLLFPSYDNQNKSFSDLRFTSNRPMIDVSTQQNIASEFRRQQCEQWRHTVTEPWNSAWPRSYQLTQYRLRRFVEQERMI